MTDTPTTILERMTSSGISPDRARAHLAAGTVRVAGEEVTDETTPAPWPSSWAVGPSN